MAADNEEPVLTTEDLTVSFGGGAVVLDGLNLTVGRGECVAILGANGAGKSTALRSITGLHPPLQGTITFQGRDITGLPAHKVAACGLVMVPEQRQLFPHLSVVDNLHLGAFTKRSSGAAYRARQVEHVLSIFPQLKDRLHHQAGSLSGGQQQMVAIGRGLMPDPALLILDEPSLGLAPQIIDLIFGVIDRLHREGGRSILLVEQNARRTLGISQRAYVLEQGQLVASGSSADLAADPAVQAAYLGMGSHEQLDGIKPEASPSGIGVNELSSLFKRERR